MATKYPNEIDNGVSLPQKINNVDPVLAKDVNDLIDTSIAIQTELGINPSGTLGTVSDRLDQLDGYIGAIGGGVVATDFIGIQVEQPEDKTYYVTTNIPYAGQLTKVTTQTVSGACTFTVNINGTPLGGGSNSASTVEQEVTHASSNAFVAGDEITFVVSANVSSEDLTATIVITKIL